MQQTKIKKAYEMPLIYIRTITTDIITVSVGFSGGTIGENDFLAPGLHEGKTWPGLMNREEWGEE